MSRSSFFKRGAQVLYMLTRQPESGFDRVAKKLELDSFTKGQCVCRMVVEEEHTNRLGTIHGGFTATLVDIATTLAILSTGPNLPGVSVNLNVSYMKAAKVGEEIKVDAKCVKIGKALAFTTADVTLADGTLLAQGKHTKYILPGTPVPFPEEDKD